MLKKNYLIINRKATAFDVMTIDNGMAHFACEGVAIGNVALGKAVYAALYCDEVKNVTLVEKDGPDVVTLLWVKEADYCAGREVIGTSIDVELSRQNLKLNRYAEDIAKKLTDGVELRVVDALDKSDMVACPDCGMLSPKGTPYCMDCGAEL